MSAPNILAEIFGGMLVLVGLTAFNKSYLTAAMGELAKSKALTWLAGLLTFVIGVASVSFYHAWSSDWRVVVTVVGWLTVLKGVFITLFPTTSIGFYRRALTSTVMTVSGIVAVLIGIVLLYLGMVS
jgi:uncharacterized membrane protein